jgi:hypothetical protein
VQLTVGGQRDHRGDGPLAADVTGVGDADRGLAEQREVLFGGALAQLSQARVGRL